MKPYPLQTVSKIFSFFLLIGLDVWIFIEAHQLYTSGISVRYSESELFWLFILVMIAPVLPQITFYKKNKSAVVAFHIVVVPIITFLVLLEPLFIPSLPVIEVILILLYSYIATGVTYLNHRHNSAKHNQAEIAYTALRIISFFIAIYAGLYFGNPDSYAANYLLFILIAIPLFLLFALTIFINFELKSNRK